MRNRLDSGLHAFRIGSRITITTDPLELLEYSVTKRPYIAVQLSEPNHDSCQQQHAKSEPHQNPYLEGTHRSPASPWRALRLAGRRALNNIDGLSLTAEAGRLRAGVPRRFRRQT